jgi:hypothetical protein
MHGRRGTQTARVEEDGHSVEAADVAESLIRPDDALSGERRRDDLIISWEARDSRAAKSRMPIPRSRPRLPAA